MDEQALKKKLAEFAGFVLQEDITCFNVWTSPDGVTIWKLPNFPLSLDACFKWLVPKLYELGFWMQWYLDINGCDVRIHHLNSQDNHSIHQDKDPALALCLAIEKLIDKGGR